MLGGTWPSRAAWGLTALILVAGCSGSSTNSESLDDSSFGESSGVRGLVIDEELRPIQGADVRLSTLDPLLTDEAGSFVFADVAPGRYSLTVNATWFRFSDQDVEVGEHMQVLSIVLQRLPSDAPYLEVFVEAGYSTCDLNLGILALSGGQNYNWVPTCEQKRTVFRTNVPATWRYAVVEVAWQGADSFTITSDENGLCSKTDPCWSWYSGSSSPLRLPAAPLDKEIAERYGSDQYGKPVYPDTPFDWMLIAWSAGYAQSEVQSVCDKVPNDYFGPYCQGVGLTLGIRFDFYLSMFHNAGPDNPDAYTALPPG